MARQHAPLFSFNQGEVSRLALARIDVARLRLAAACQVNWTPWVLGPMMLRPGLIHIGEVYNDQPAKLLRFIFSKLDVALLELTDELLRVWVAEALVTRAAVSTAITDPTFIAATGWVTTGTTAGAVATANTGEGVLADVPVGGLARLQKTVAVAGGDQGVEHGLRIVITNGPVTLRVGSTAGASDLIAQTTLDTGTHSLAFTPTTATFVLQLESTDAWRKQMASVSIDAAGALTLPAPWTADDQANVRYDQSGDVIFVACYGVPQYKIERRSATSWSVARYYSADGPFKALPGVDANFTVDTYTGNGTMTSDRPYFQSGHVGALFRLFVSGQFYATFLGAENAVSPAVRVSGVGTLARDFTWGAAGTYVGVLTHERSFDGPDSGFSEVAQAISGATGTIFSSSTGGAAGVPPLDNIVCWERVRFKAGDYTSGYVSVGTDYQGDGGYGIVRVVGYTSPTSVSVEVLQSLPRILATKDWVEQDWSGVFGYPSSTAFFDGRLFWLGRDQFWGSVSNNYVSYADQDSLGNAIGDSGALNEQFGAGPVDTVSWGLGLTRLLAGREGSIASIRASAFDEVLTPTNISSKDCATQGAARLPAVKVDTRGVFVQQSGRRVYELAFDPKLLDYVPNDLTRLNLDIGKPGFVAIDAQRQPDTNIYLPRAEGQVAVLLHDPADEVECWWRIQTAGVIEDVAVLPDAGIEDLVYFVVRRTINGQTKRFIERLAHRDSCVGGALNVQADCCFSYSGTAVSTVQVPWLPNTDVIVWADGADLGAATTDASGNCVLPDGATHANIVVGLGGTVVTGSTSAILSNNTAPDHRFDNLSNTLTVPDLYEGCPAEVFADIGGTGRPKHIGTVTVDNGRVALPDGRTASTITACLGYVAPFMSAKLAYAAQLGTALTQKKKIDHVGLVLQDVHAQGLKSGQSFAVLDDMPAVEAGAETAVDVVWLEYDEQMIEVSGEWDTDARLCLLAQAPRPCTVAGVVVDMSTNG